MATRLQSTLMVEEHYDEKRPIFVAATKQHVGKTSTSLALMSGLQKRFDKVGFMKPVGQVCLPVWEEDLQQEIQVDKDVVVMRQHFGLDSSLPYRYMSPVLIPKGYTKDYLDGNIREDKHEELVRQAYDNISRASDVGTKKRMNLLSGVLFCTSVYTILILLPFHFSVLCEGTGHAAVGSIVGASNARVASWLGAEMVLVANGGLGSTFDELELNKILCDHHNVPIAGVIINKVIPDKLEQTRHFLEKALDKNWGVPLLGVIPDRPFLGCPALQDLERLFGSKLLSGQEQSLRHYTMRDLNLVATSLSVFLENLRIKPARTLYVCHASREDIVLGFLAEYQRRTCRNEPFEAALIICGRPDRFSLDPQVLDMIEQTKNAPPILRSPYTPREAMEMIHNYTPKLNMADSDRVSTTVNHYEPYIDFDLLLERTGNTPSENNVKSAAAM